MFHEIAKKIVCSKINKDLFTLDELRTEIRKLALDAQTTTYSGIVTECTSDIGYAYVREDDDEMGGATYLYLLNKFNSWILAGDETKESILEDISDVKGVLHMYADEFSASLDLRGYGPGDEEDYYYEKQQIIDELHLDMDNILYDDEYLDTDFGYH